MKRKLLSIILANICILSSVAILFVLNTSAANENILINPDFEKGTMEGWTSVNNYKAEGSVSEFIISGPGTGVGWGVAHEGNYSAYAQSSKLYQTVTLQKSGTYQVGGWFYANNMECKLSVYSGEGINGSVLAAATENSNRNWIELTATFKARKDDVITVVYHGWQGNSNAWLSLGVDDTSLVLLEEDESYVGVNLLKNNSFDTGNLTGWTPTNSDGIAVYNTQGPTDGAYCTFGTNSSVYQEVTIPATGTYSVSGWYKSRDAVDAYLTVYKSAYNGEKIADIKEKLESGWTWKQLSGTFKAKAGDKVVLEMRIWTNGYIQQFYDNASLKLLEESAPEAGDNLLKNGDFEKGTMEGWTSENYYKAEGSQPEFIISKVGSGVGWSVVHGGDCSAYAQSTKLFQTVTLPQDGTYLAGGWLYANNMECYMDVYSGANAAGTVLCSAADDSNRQWTELSATFTGKQGDIVTICFRGWQGNTNAWLSLGVDDTQLILIEKTSEDGNILVNGGFELGNLTCWKATDIDGIAVYDNQSPTEGKYCTFGTNSYIYQSVKLTKSGIYSASGWFNSNSAVDAYLNVHSETADGDLIATATEKLEGSYKWKQLKTTFTANAGDVIVLKLKVWTNGYVQQFYDGAVLKLDKEIIKENLLKNPDFETGDLSNWTVSKDADGTDGSVSTTAHKGAYSAYLTDTLISQDVTLPSTGVYSFGGWADANSGKTVSMTVKDAESQEKLGTSSVTVSSAWTWNEMSNTFWAKEGTIVTVTVDFSQTQWAHAKYFDDAYLYFEYEAETKPHNGIAIYKATPYGPTDPLWDNVEAYTFDYVKSYETGKTYKLSSLSQSEKDKLGLTTTVSFKIVADSGCIYIQYYIHDINIIKNRPQGYQWFEDWAIEGIYSTTHDGVTYTNNYYSNYYNMNYIIDVDDENYIGMRVIPISALSDLFGIDPDEFNLQIVYRDTAPEGYTGKMYNTYHFLYSYDGKQSIIPFWFADEVVKGTEDYSIFVPVDEPEDFKELSVNLKELSKHQSDVNTSVPDVYLDPTENVILVGNESFSYKTVYNCLIFGKGVKATLCTPDKKDASKSSNKIKDGAILKLTLPNGKQKEYKVLLTGSF